MLNYSTLSYRHFSNLTRTLINANGIFFRNLVNLFPLIFKRMTVELEKKAFGFLVTHEFRKYQK